MGAGNTMQGRRLSDETSPADMEPGDYLLRGERWFVRLPSGYGPVSLDHSANGGAWSITEHDDGTITASPSIFDAPDGWHGYLERGVWRSV